MSSKEHAKEIHQLLKQAADLPRRARGDPDKYLHYTDALVALVLLKRGKMLKEIKLKKELIDDVLNMEFYSKVPNPDLFVTLACVANAQYFLECANSFYNLSWEPDTHTDQVLNRVREASKVLLQFLRDECNKPLPQCQEDEQTAN
jgi:hypothetical protein